MTYFEPYKTGYLLRVKLAPGASSCGVRGVFYDADRIEYLKISVNSIAEKGKANKELQKWLTKTLKISAGSVELLSGATEHLKKLYINIPQNDENIEKLQQLNSEKQR